MSSSTAASPLKMNKSDCRSQVLDSYVKELSGDFSHPINDRWNTMYKSSYNERPSQSDKNYVTSSEITSHDGMQCNLAKAYKQNYAEHGKSSNSYKNGIHLQDIANNGSNSTGYRLVESAKCKWFVESQRLNSPRQTMYQTHFPNPHARLTSATKSRAQYRLEQVYRHMGNCVSN